MGSQRFPHRAATMADSHMGSIGKVGKHGKKTEIGVCRSIFTLNFKLRKAPKLRRNIKIHGELVVVNFHFQELIKVFISMIVVPRGNFQDPQKPLFLILDTPDYSK